MRFILIFYKWESIGTRRVDFFVEGNIIVELKALIQLEDVHLAHVINYLEAYKMDIGLLINFGARSLEFKRVMKPGKKYSSSKNLRRSPLDILIKVQAMSNSKLCRIAVSVSHTCAELKINMYKRST